MRVCFFIATLNNSGGTERALTAIASQLSENNSYDVSIICWSGGSTSFFDLSEKTKCYSLYQKAGINIYAKYIPSLIKYISLIRQIKPDIIVDVCVPLSLITIPATRFMKVKVVSWEQFNLKVTWNFFTATLSRWLASKYSNKIVVLTKTDKEEYIKRFKSDNQFVIPNPVSISVKETSSLSAKIVLAVGRLTYQKGFDLLLQAWQKVVTNNRYKDEIQSWKLYIVGGGEDEQKLKELSEKLGLQASVSFFEPTKQIESFFGDASIFVMSSRFEGLPLALIEAKAFGLPTISFDCETGPREVISHEEDGLLVEVNDIDALSEALIKLIIDPKTRKLYGVKSEEKSKRFALQEIVKSWDYMLKDL